MPANIVINIQTLFWYLYRYCSAWLRLTLNTEIGLHTTTIQTLRQQYLSSYWPDFEQTSNVGSWEHLKQISNVTMTFVQVTYVLATFAHISNISANPILTKFFWP